MLSGSVWFLYAPFKRQVRLVRMLWICPIPLRVVTVRFCFVCCCEVVPVVVDVAAFVARTTSMVAWHGSFDVECTVSNHKTDAGFV